ncbi:MAG TPA: TerB family tellurite resistance protein, partial [Chitinophagales bacterium]|nr:TerB family tellurite resistance protein [Chitinophagales bacterium]
LIKIDGRVTHAEIDFTEQFLNAHFEQEYSAQRSQILNHCLQKEYDLNVVCGQIRSYTELGTRIQVVRFLFELAMCDGALNERENFFIFKIAGYLNVNDVDFRKIKGEHHTQTVSVYEVLGARKDMQFAEIRTLYRKLVLKYHPDRNKDLSESEKQKMAAKFREVHEAYEKIKAERSEK